MTSAASRDVKTAVMGASEMPPGLPLGLGAAVQAAASSIVSPRGAAKRKAGAAFNPVLMSGLNPVASGLNPAASMTRSLSPPGGSGSNAPGEHNYILFTYTYPTASRATFYDDVFSML